MMGQQSGGHEQLFYSFNLDDHVPSEHLLRGIDRFLDLGDLHQHLAPFYEAGSSRSESVIPTACQR
jgi:hypothetical protein